MNNSVLENFNNALVLTGPTASGKTALGIVLAKEIGAEIISMDSMALYRGMDIGTAKPTAVERAEVPHHLIDVLDPWQSSSVAWWLEEAARCVKEIAARGKRVLFVGGTALYLKAMMFGLFEGPEADAEIRSQLEKEAKELGAEHLHQRLAQVDARTAARVHPCDVRRVVRALEVWQLTGRPLSAWQQQWQQEEPRNRLRCVWLDWPREELYRRINVRVEKMFEAGFVEEVARLKDLPYPLSREARQAVGYREVLEHLEREMSLEKTVESIQTRSRQFAKRQVTWFRHLPGCDPVSGELTSGELRRKMEQEA